MQSQDIRKWFMKKHEKDTGNGDTSKLAKPSAPANPNATAQPGNLVQGGQESSSGRKKTSKYFAKEETVKDEMDVDEVSPKKVQRGGTESASNVRVPPGKKTHKLENDDEDEDDDFVTSTSRKGSTVPNKKLKTSSGRGVARKMDVDEVDEDEDGGKVKSALKSGGSGRGRGKKDPSVSRTTAKAMDVDEVDEDDDDGKVKSNLKSAGRGRGRGTKGPSVVQTAAKAKDADEIDEADMDDKDDVKPLNPGGRGRGGGRSAPAGGRGRGGGGRGGFANFGERKDPPHKGEKEVPEGADNCLGGLTFVITGTLDSLEREEAEDLIKRYGGRVTGSVSKKTNYLLCDDDVGGRKSEKAMELGTSFLKEDGLFDMIRASNKSKPTTPVKESKKLVDKVAPSPPKKSPQKPEKKLAGNIVVCSDTKELSSAAVLPKQKSEPTAEDILPWTEKYRPKLEKDIVGNQSLVKQLRDWLVQWNNQFLNTGKKAKGKKQNDSGDKKAILLCGTPGIGKTSSAKLISKMLGFQTIEVNASDSRGKADAKIEKGIGGSTSNSVKELVSNEALCLNMQRSHHQKTVLIMDEVDGMSAGDRGGVADLIASIKMSKIPIICICNDRYSQKLKSLVNHCLVLNFKKPLKQQISKRLAEISRLEGIHADGNALEELAERVNGDIRMAVNQLQYMSLSMSVIKFDDIKQRLKNSSKDEDISPFTAVDKLFGFNAGRLRMDERVDLCMSDPDLVPLIIQENYINYRPSSGGKDDNEMKRMSFLARAAESIGDGDIVNVQIRRFRQWQLSQTGCLASCIIPAALMHGQRGTFEQGEKNYNRFGGWLGKNSTMGKNYRLLEDLHVHHLASRGSNSGRATLRLDYLTLLLKRLTDPLKTLPKDEAVEKVVEFMDLYSISMEDLDTIMELSKFKGHPNPMEGVQPAVKAALTRAYKKGSSSRVVRAADLITLPGIKKAPKKRVAAMLEPIEDSPMGENVENEEDTPSDAEDQEEDDDDDLDPEKKLESLNSKGIRVQMELKGLGSSTAKKGSGRGKGSSVAATASDTKKAGRGGGAGAKRKR